MSLSRYPPLPRQAGQNSLRLLMLQPGHPGDNIVCYLQVASIPNRGGHSVVYDALSYAWGTEEPTFDITIDAWSVAIRGNLWNCIQHIRDPEQETPLWIDALCINQLDLEERASQVRVMNQVYRGARKVLVWLGSSDEESAAAMHMIREIANGGSMRIDNIESLLVWSQRAYWTRTWIVQEFLLARDVVLICGADRLDWSTTERFLRKIERGSVDANSGAPTNWSLFWETPAAHLMQQRYKRSDPLEPLSDLLIRNRDTECRDPRDKVYAMLGLSSDLDRGHAIRVSYTKDTRMLLFEVLVQCQVQAKNVLRWARFLTGALSIERDLIWSTARKRSEMRNAPGAKPWTVSGFPTGEIVDCRRLSGLSELDVVSRGLDVLSTAHGDEYGRRRSDAVRSLNEDDTIRLEAAMASLQSVGPSSPRVKSKMQQQSEPSTYLAVVLTSGCRQREILVAICHGRVKKGDTVLQFLGNELALVLDAEDENRSITGCLLFPQASQDTSDRMVDSLTGQPCLHRVLQSEAACSGSTKAISRQMTQTQILALTQ